jgi:DNA replication protein DnaC
MRSHKETYSMTNEELDRALRQLRLGGMADVLAIRAQQARADNLGPLDFLGMLVHDELERRRDRLVSRRVKNAGFRDVKTLDTFDWSFNASFDRAHIFDLATSRFIERHDDVLMLGNAGVGKSHIAQAIGMAAIHAGFHVLYREAHVLFEEYLPMRSENAPARSRTQPRSNSSSSTIWACENYRRTPPKISWKL